MKRTIEELLADWGRAAALERQASDLNDEVCIALRDARKRLHAASVEYHNAMDEKNAQWARLKEQL